MWPFFNPTIEVVTFCFRGWCMLGVLLLLAFIRLGHECAQTRPPFILSFKRVFGGKFPLPEKFSSEEDWTHDTASSRTASSTHYQWAIPAPVISSESDYLTLSVIRMFNLNCFNSITNCTSWSVDLYARKWFKAVFLGCWSCDPNPRSRPLKSA